MAAPGRIPRQRATTILAALLAASPDTDEAIDLSPEWDEPPEPHIPLENCKPTDHAPGSCKENKHDKHAPLACCKAEEMRRRFEAGQPLFHLDDNTILGRPVKETKCARSLPEGISYSRAKKGGRYQVRVRLPGSAARVHLGWRREAHDAVQLLNSARAPACWAACARPRKPRRKKVHRDQLTIWPWVAFA